MKKNFRKNLRKNLRKLAGLLALTLALTAGFAPAPAAQDQPQLLDSLEDYQKRLDGLLKERLKAVVPSGNFVVRILVVGKNVEVPRPPSRRPASELPGFRRQAVQPVRTVEKFQVETVSVRIIVNDNLAPAEQEYIRTVVPLLAEFRPERGDQLDLQVLPPAVREEEEAGASRPAFDLDTKDWLLLGLLGMILLLLLVVMFRVLFAPRAMRPPPAQDPYQQYPGPPAAPSPAAAAPPPPDRKDDADALQAQEQGKQLDALRHGVVKGLFARNDLGRQLIQAWQDQPDKVGGLIHALGPTVARKALLPHLDRERYQALEEAVRQDSPPSTESLIDLMREANLYLVAQELANPEEIRPDPFAFLQKLSRGQVGHLIQDEPVRIKAIALSRIHPGDTAQILDSMPKEMQLEVAVQIGNFQSMPLDMAEDVARDLAVKARDVPDAATMDIEGTKKLVDLMGRTSFDTSRYLLDALKAKDTELSEKVERRFFMFEAIPLVPDDVLPQVVRTLPSNTIIQALQGADQDIQRKVIMAFPEQARPGLVTTLRASQFDEETVMEARRQIIGGFQSLAEQGKIDLKEISDAWQAQAS